MYNFFIDDNVFFFHDLHRRLPASVFDNHYLAGLREAHRRFGTKFTLNTFYRNWHAPEFDISLLTDRYRSEFEKNSDWLKLAFHGYCEFPERPYSEAFPEKFVEHYEAWRGEIVRIAGEKTIFPPVIFHYFDAAPEPRRYLRERGMKFYTVRDGDGIVYNPEFDQYEIPLDIFLNRLRGNIAGIRDALEKKISSGRQKLLIGSHEQYAFPYYERYIPEYFDGLFAACELMYRHKYEPEYFNAIV